MNLDIFLELLLKFNGTSDSFNFIRNFYRNSIVNFRSELKLPETNNVTADDIATAFASYYIFKNKIDILVLQSAIKKIQDFYYKSDKEFRSKINNTLLITFLSAIETGIAKNLNEQLKIGLNKLQTYSLDIYKAVKKEAEIMNKNEDIEGLKFLIASVDATNDFLQTPSDVKVKKAFVRIIDQAERRQLIDYTKKLAYLFSAVLLKLVGNSKKSEQMNDKSKACSAKLFARKGVIDNLNDIKVNYSVRTL